MERKLSALARRYEAALRKHLKAGPHGGLLPALRLGRQAVVLGLETLELARIHERSIMTLKLSNGKNGLLKRAEWFFSEAITPIVETHHAARQRRVELRRLNAKLGQRTEELAASNRQVQQGVARRKVMKEDFEKSGKQHHKCLEESLQLQKLLRRMTHKALAAQENDRTRISRELRDEIAQTLLGINVRLLSLKQNAGCGSKGLKNQIVSVQRLVLKSARSVRRFARELGRHQKGAGDRSLTML